MIITLTAGEIPDKKELARRLTAALTKKMAILRQPYLFWPADPKINPLARHLLWAAFILEDSENFTMAGDILLEEKIQSGVGGKSTAESPENLKEKLINEGLAELLQISKNDSLNNQLRAKIAAKIE